MRISDAVFNSVNGEALAYRMARDHGDQVEQVMTKDVVTLCGSTKFKEQFHAENQRLTLEGKLVISLGVFGHVDLPDFNWEDGDIKAMLDQLHFRKIDLAETVHVINPGGYVGSSTKREIEYARRTGKKITSMEPL